MKPQNNEMQDINNPERENRTELGEIGYQESPGYLGTCTKIDENGK